jgi:hypothetical protein
VRPQDEHDLRTVLRHEADRHEPDRDAMRRRIDRAREATPDGTMARVAAAFRRPLPAVRPVAVAAAVTGVLVLAIAGIDLAGRSPAPPTPVAAPVTAARSPAPSLAGTAAPPTAHPSPHRSTSSLGPPIATSASASASAANDGFLTAVPALDPHSIATWAQSNLTVTTTEKITALDVTIKVARTAGVAKTGHWSSIPADLTVQTVHTSTGSLLYRFTLTDGSTLAAGTYTFAAQYDHAAGPRSTEGDTWTATSGSERLSGSFS